MTFSIRPPLDRDEALRFFRLACPALLAPVSAAEGWMEREGYANSRLAFDGHALAGGLMVQRLAQWFGGNAVPSGAVRGVAVAPARRGREVALRLMRHALDELRAGGVPLAVLFPATQKLYRKTGFEQAGSYEVVSLPLHELGTGSPDVEVRAVTPNDPILVAIHEASGARSQGVFRRNSWLWRRLTDPSTPLDLEAYVFGAAESPEGYVLVHCERGTDPHFGTLVVRDRAFVTDGAIRSARALFARYRSTMDRVRLASSPVDAAQLCPALTLGTCSGTRAPRGVADPMMPAVLHATGRARRSGHYRGHSGCRRPAHAETCGRSPGWQTDRASGRRAIVPRR